MVVPLNSIWKIPIVYFLIDGLSADVKANLVNEAIVHLYDVNVRVAAVVCDGPSTNFGVDTKLGAILSVENMNPSFKHPCNALWSVYMIFDAAHMIKLMRNTLAEKAVLTNKDGQQIRWDTSETCMNCRV